jgi:hypothetical protein
LRAQFLQLLLLFRRQNLCQARIHVLLQFIELGDLLVGHIESVSDECRQDFTRSRWSAEPTRAASLTGTTTDASTWAASRTSSPSAETATWSSLSTGTVEASRPIGRSATSAAQGSTFLLEQLRQLFVGDDAIAIGVGPFEERRESPVGELVFAQLAVVIGVE